MDHDDLQRVIHEETVIEQNINPQFDEIRGRLDNLEGDVAKIKIEMVTKDEFNHEIGKIKSEMVTKAYLDDKLSDFADNLDAKRPKEDGKVNRLIGMLKDKSIINEGDVRQLKDSQAITQ